MARHLRRAMQMLLAILIVVFSSLVFLQVVIRYVIDLGLFGLNDATALMAVWMYFLGAGYAASTGEHITASLVDVVFPQRQGVQRATAMVAHGATALVMLVFAWWAAEYAWWAHQQGAVTSELKLPRLHFAVPIALGCLMMAWFFGLAAWRDGRGGGGGPARDGDASLAPEAVGPEAASRD